MKMRLEFTIDRDEAGLLLLAMADPLPASKVGFVQALRHAVKWNGASMGGGMVEDLAQDHVEDDHRAHHGNCGGPWHCEERSPREKAVERLLDDYWEQA